MPGAGRSYQLPLIALRRLRATVTLASGVTPLDDGEGPASVRRRPAGDPARKRTDLRRRAPHRVCASAVVATLEGLLIGSGTYYLAAGVDDYNLGGSLPPGGLISLDVSGNMFSLPATSRVVVAPNAYTVNHTVPLNFVVPLGDGGTPAPYACPIADAGTSD